MPSKLIRKLMEGLCGAALVHSLAFVGDCSKSETLKPILHGLLGNRYLRTVRGGVVSAVICSLP